MNVQGHMTSIEDIGVVYSAIKAFHNIGFTTLKDVLYVADIMNTLVLIDTFSTGNAFDSKVDVVELAKLLADPLKP